MLLKHLEFMIACYGVYYFHSSLKHLSRSCEFPSTRTMAMWSKIARFLNDVSFISLGKIIHSLIDPHFAHLRSCTANDATSLSTIPNNVSSTSILSCERPQDAQGQSSSSNSTSLTRSRSCTNVQALQTTPVTLKLSQGGLNWASSELR